MAASTQLFVLVKSLSNREKQSFRRFCNIVQGGDKNYLKLFDCIDAMENYDEELIKESFTGEKFINSLHVTKNYLYNLIMKSLRSFYSHVGIDQKIGELLADCSILERRGLYEQSEDALAKAKKMAYDYHRYNYLVPILRKAASNLFYLEDKNLGSNLEAINLELQKIKDELDNEFIAYSLYHKWAIYERGHNLASEETSNLLAETDKSYTLDNTNSFYTKYLRESVAASVSKYRGDVVQHHLKAKAVVELWRSEGVLVLEEPQIYKVHLANYLNTCFRMAKWEEFPVLIEEFKSLPSNNFDQKAESFQNIAFYELLYWLNTMQLGNALNALTNITRDMETYKSKINTARKLAFYYNISILYFMLGKFEEALLWINKILNHSKTEHRKDIQRFSHILQLIYHYELGSFNLLDNLIDSVKRKINRWSKLNEFELEVLKTLQELLYSKSNVERQRTYIFLKVKLDGILASNNKKLGHEELLLWLEKKLKN